MWTTYGAAQFQSAKAAKQAREPTLRSIRRVRTNRDLWRPWRHGDSQTTPPASRLANGCERSPDPMPGERSGTRGADEREVAGPVSSRSSPRAPIRRLIRLGPPIADRWGGHSCSTDGVVTRVPSPARVASATSPSPFSGPRVYRLNRSSAAQRRFAYRLVRVTRPLTATRVSITRDIRHLTTARVSIRRVDRHPATSRVSISAGHPPSKRRSRIDSGG